MPLPKSRRRTSRSAMLLARCMVAKKSRDTIGAMRSLLITGLILGLIRLASAGPNDATPPGAKPLSDAEQAEKLFEEGRQLKDHGQLQKACEKFDQALQLNRN